MSEDRIAGQVSPDGTRAVAKSSSMGEGFYREHEGLRLSTYGVGTYLGEPTDEVSEGYQAAIERAIERGVTVLDTAINYRNQRSERDVGAVLAKLGEQAREGVLVSTKGGFLHADAQDERSPAAYVSETYIETGLVGMGELVGQIHCMAPAYVAAELEHSLANLGLQTVDIYLVHNPETQLQQGVPRQTVYDRLQAAFEQLEREPDAGKLVRYGVATWDGLRVGPGHRQHLSLARLLAIAEEVHADLSTAGEVDTVHHGFGAVQLPFNLGMTEACTQTSQLLDGAQVSAFEAARQAGLIVLTSASIAQGQVAGQVPGGMQATLGIQGDVPAGIQFARSPAGVTTALVGTSSPAHLDANLDALEGLSPDPDAVDALLHGG